MLVAEIHGSYVADARSYEDYLTSAVFAHLRYIKPGPFWDLLFSRAISQPIESRQMNASELIQNETGCSLGSYSSLDAIFWPIHDEGVPDLVLHFSGGQDRQVVIVIEAKLNAGKSGSGDHDQLARYMRILDSLTELRPPLPQHALGLLVYLTTTDSRADVIESLAEYGDTSKSRKRLYQLRWQDLIEVIDETRPRSDVEALILKDVRKFLQVRDLEYFSGMGDPKSLPDVVVSDGDFLIGEPLFEIGNIPTNITGIEERWMHGD